MGPWRGRVRSHAALALAFLALVVSSQGATPPTYKIGSIFALTGALSDESKEQRSALRAGVSYVNAKGLLPFNASFAIAGPYDDMLDRATSLEASIELRNLHVMAVVGPNTSPNAVISHLIFKKALQRAQYRTPQCSIATSPTLSDANEFPYFFRTQGSDAGASPMLVQLCYRMGWRKIGILSTSDDYGTSFARSLYTEALAGGILVTMTDGATRDASGAIDFSSQLSILLRADVRIIFLFAYNADAFVAYQRAAQFGMVGPKYVWVSEHSKFTLNDQLAVSVPGAYSEWQLLFTGMLFFTSQPGSGPVYDDFLVHFANDRQQELNNGTSVNATRVTRGAFSADDQPVNNNGNNNDVRSLPVVEAVTAPSIDPRLVPRLVQSPLVFDCVVSVAQAVRFATFALDEAGYDVAGIGGNLTGMSPVNVSATALVAAALRVLAADNSTYINVTAISAKASTFGELLMASVRATTFVGASGSVRFDKGGDRSPSYSLWNYVSGRNVMVGQYTRAQGLALTAPVVFSGGSSTNPGDGVEGNSLSTGEIVGIVFGCIGFVIIVGVLVLATTVVRRANRRAKEQEGLRKLEEERRRDALIQTKIAKEGDKTKSLFLANMSHEIRSPLNGILGIAQLLEDESTNPAQRESLSTIRRCGESLLLILNDILDFSKLEANLMVVKKEPFDFFSVIEDVVSLHAELAFRKNLDISFHACCSCPSCASGGKAGGDARCLLQPNAVGALGEAGRFTQVLSNLVSNAIKFTETGSVTVCASLVPDGAPLVSRCALSPGSQSWPSHVVDAETLITRGETKESDAEQESSLKRQASPEDEGIELVDVHVDGEVGKGHGMNAQNAVLLFEVHDTGIGLLEAELPRLFSRFHQGDNSLTKKYQGTGLGLAISASLINLMGGRIGVRSATGRGSVFWCTLPLCEPAVRKPNKSGAYFSYTRGAPTTRTQSRVSDTQATVESHGALQADVVTVYSGSAPFLACARTCCGLLGVACTTTTVAPPIQPSLLQPVLGDLDWAIASSPRSSGAEGETSTMPHTVAGITWFGSPRRGVAATVHRKPLTRSKLYVALSREPTESAAAIVPELPTAAAPISVPFEEQDLSARETATSTAVDGASAGDLKVLVAEDNVINQKVALRIVKNTGYGGVGVEDGRQVVDAYLASPGSVGLILMDLQMPNVNGIDATREIRAIEAQRGLARVPIYALTASAIGDIERDCLANGMDGFVSKPFRKQELEATIRTVCQAHARSKQASS